MARLKHGSCCLNERQVAERCGLEGHAQRRMTVANIGREVVQVFTLLEQAGAQFPDARTVVVGAHDDPALAELAWDLGADFVLFPPFSWEHLPSIVTGLMELPAAEQPEVIAEE